MEALNATSQARQRCRAFSFLQERTSSLLNPTSSRPERSVVERPLYFAFVFVVAGFTPSQDPASEKNLV
jgi:hypothetical protein